MDLLSPAQHAQIRAALQDVIDTFHDTPITYQKYVAKVEDYMEDMGKKQYNVFSFNGFVEYPSAVSSQLDETEQGAYNQAEVKVTCGIDNLEAVGLLDAENMPNFTPEEDRMIVNGKAYVITFVGTDGALEKKNVLAVVLGRRVPELT